MISHRTIHDTSKYVVRLTMLMWNEYEFDYKDVRLYFATLNVTPDNLK